MWLIILTIIRSVSLISSSKKILIPSVRWCCTLLGFEGLISIYGVNTDGTKIESADNKVYVCMVKVYHYREG